MKRLKNRIVLLFTIVLSLTVGLYLANAIAWYLLSRGWIKDRDARAAIYYAQKPPHPYLGFLAESKKGHNPEWSGDLLEFTKPAPRNKIRIGIFGGSVASQIFAHWQASPEIRERLNRILKKKTGKSSELELIEFSDGARYQPQALITALLYAKELDLAINIEGSNELYRSINLFPVEFPRTRLSNIYFSASFTSHLALLGIDLLLAADSMLAPVETDGAWPSLAKVTRISLSNLGRRWFLGLDSRETEFAQNDQSLVDLWAWSLHKQNYLFKDEGTTHVIFIQPLPCIDDGKRELSVHEAEFCPTTDRAVISKPIELFRRTAIFDTLDVIDFSRFFRDEKEEMFLDDPHLNDRGLDLLTDGMLSEIAKKKFTPRAN